jgi:hypothetical protein
VLAEMVSRPILVEIEGLLNLDGVSKNMNTLVVFRVEKPIIFNNIIPAAMYL